MTVFIVDQSVSCFSDELICFLVKNAQHHILTHHVLSTNKIILGLHFDFLSLSNESN